MELKLIPIEQIHPNSYQPRASFEQESLEELAVSLKDATMVQPIVVRQHNEGYQIIAGERRWRAAKIAGLRELPCVIKEIPDEKVLLESLVENLHRKDLTDEERENAIHVLWASGFFRNQAEIARALGTRVERVKEDIEAWEFRHENRTNSHVPTWVIGRTRGLPTEERKQIIGKVESGEFKTTDILEVPKIMRSATEKLKNELLKPKSFVTPKMAETIVEKLGEEEQNVVLEEIKRQRLTEDEVEKRVIEIQRAKESGEPLRKEMLVQEGIIYTVGEYECPHCKKHYLIRCNGKKDWVE